MERRFSLPPYTGILLGNSGYFLIFQQFAVSDGGVCLYQDALVLGVLNQLFGCVADVGQNLVDHRFHCAGVKNVFQVNNPTCGFIFDIARR
ncbi:MAG: hypothetical protein H6658_12160 [Ardenticatenaceae bacterium]|nr:hypothetical protein [Ardenticatenaceae bacterium]